MFEKLCSILMLFSKKEIKLKIFLKKLFVMEKVFEVIVKESGFRTPEYLTVLESSEHEYILRIVFSYRLIEPYLFEPYF